MPQVRLGNRSTNYDCPQGTSEAALLLPSRSRDVNFDVNDMPRKKKYHEFVSDGKVFRWSRAKRIIGIARKAVVYVSEKGKKGIIGWFKASRKNIDNATRALQKAIQKIIRREIPPVTVPRKKILRSSMVISYDDPGAGIVEYKVWIHSEEAKSEEELWEWMNNLTRLYPSAIPLQFDRIELGEEIEEDEMLPTTEQDKWWGYAEFRAKGKEYYAIQAGPDFEKSPPFTPPKLGETE